MTSQSGIGTRGGVFVPCDMIISPILSQIVDWIAHEKECSHENGGNTKHVNSNIDLMLRW